MQIVFGLVSASVLTLLGMLAEQSGFGAGLLGVGVGVGLLNIAAWAAPRFATLKVANEEGAAK